ncbi:MAG: TonB-dependent receptor [Ahniella sp.]|nr:TonB-dependent receptor [Ahniella sp.]
MPIRIIDRAEIDASGDVSVAELLRDSTLASFGNYRPLSGSTTQSMSDIDLRGLGSDRTLVLVDGRPVVGSPFDPAVANLNLIPIGAVERIEILPEGASAIYGANAAGGVVNIILRKSIDGAEVSWMVGNPRVRGGDMARGDASFGANGDRGRVIATVSYNKREIVYSRDQIDGQTLGLSGFANNYRIANAAGTAAIGPLIPLPGFDCSGSGTGVGGLPDLFFETNPGGPDNFCSFNFNGIAANDASTDTSALYTAGEYQINDDWLTYLQASVTRNESFGRRAPSVSQMFVAEGSVSDPVPGDGRGAYIRHRFAGVGPLDTSIDENAYDLRLGVKGRVGEAVDVEFGARRYEHQAFQLSRNVVVNRLAQQAIDSGSYDLRHPFDADRATLDSMSATVNRDGFWLGRELFGMVTFNPFELAGGESTLVLGAEWRDEDYADQYDPLQSSGEVQNIGLSSSMGDRSVRAAYFEWLLPVSNTFDVIAAGRFDDFSDYGSDVSPKVVLRWQPSDQWTVRGSWSQGFVPPGLDDYPGEGVIPIAELHAAQTQHLGLGANWDASHWLHLSADYYRVDIDDRIVEIPLPLGLSLPRDPVTGALLFTLSALDNAGTLDTEGLDLAMRTRFDLGAQGELVSKLQASHVRRYELGEPGQVAHLTGDLAGEFGFPDLRANLTHDWSLDDFGVRWQTHYIAGTRESFADPAIGGYTTHDLQLRWKAPWHASITIGATNLGDKYPSLASGTLGRPWNTLLYDALGRTPYVRYVQTF